MFSVSYVLNMKTRKASRGSAISRGPRIAAAAVAISAALSVPFAMAADPYRIDRAFKSGNYLVREKTSDDCNAPQIVHIESAEGTVKLRPGETRFFMNPRPSEKWIWYCSKDLNRARIHGANYVKAVRQQNGVIDWYWVELIP